jgi:peptidyl-tRNA hydrolase
VGIAFAQVVHAAGESSNGKLKPGTYAVALSVESEQQLRSLADELEAKGVPVHRVEESHGKYAGQLMALGIAPGPKSVRGQHLSTLPLIRFGDFIEHHDAMQWAFAEKKALGKKYRAQIAELRRRIAELESSWWARAKRWWKSDKALSCSEEAVK